MKYYRYKGNIYSIVRLVSMKNPKSNKWEDAVLYLPIKTKEDTKPYVRLATDFYTKFEEIDEQRIKE